MKASYGMKLTYRQRAQGPHLPSCRAFLQACPTSCPGRCSCGSSLRERHGQPERHASRKAARMRCKADLRDIEVDRDLDDDGTGQDDHPAAVQRVAGADPVEDL